MRAVVAIVLIVAGLATGVLGYGWWHSATHATFHVTLRDAAVKEKFDTVCFRAHAEWLLTWVPRARTISIVAGNCRIERAPIYFSSSRDSMWTWWIPLPHVGGTPYTNFNAFLQIDSRTCAVIPLRG